MNMRERVSPKTVLIVGGVFGAGLVMICLCCGGVSLYFTQRAHVVLQAEAAERARVREAIALRDAIDLTPDEAGEALQASGYRFVKRDDGPNLTRHVYAKPIAGGTLEAIVGFSSTADLYSIGFFARASTYPKGGDWVEWWSVIETDADALCAGAGQAIRSSQDKTKRITRDRAVPLGEGGVDRLEGATVLQGRWKIDTMLATEMLIEGQEQAICVATVASVD